MQNEAGWQGMATGLTTMLSWCRLLKCLQGLRAEQTRRPPRIEAPPC